MAIEKKIKIKVDSSYAVKNLDELNKINLKVFDKYLEVLKLHLKFVKNLY